VIVLERDAIDQVIRAGRVAAQHGWIPATSGNFSVRADDDRVAVTRSGCDKGALKDGDIAVVALDAPPPGGLSAEAPLHLARYRNDAAVGAVFHVHMASAALISRLHADRGGVTLEGWELQKAFAGVASHDEALRVPIFANSQDIEGLAVAVEEALARVGRARPAPPGYLIAGHGLYAWGRNAAEAERHLEAFDFLFRLQLEWMRLTT
jgi:methylthioribulose-1-phosphate dehydratase